MVTTTLEPADAATAAQMLAEAAREGRRVVPTGNGTKLSAMVLDADAVPLSSARLNSGLAHYAGDLVATVPAGATLHEVNAVLGTERQWLPLDPRFASRATIGGIVATNDSGPRRHGYGAPRDLIIGIEVALTSGSVVHAGGRVVKNVAGYDLSRLFCGSRGSLGMITGVTFKLAPLPQASRTVVARFTRTADAVSAALQLAASPLTPSTVELVSPEPRLLVRFESTLAAAQRMAEAATTLLARENSEVVILAEEAESRLWDSLAGWGTSGALVLGAAVLPDTSARLLNSVEAAGRDRGVTCAVAGRAALGVYTIAIDGTAESVLAFAADVCAAAREGGGHVQVAGATATLVRQASTLADTPGSAAAIGEAVKQRFDPAGILPRPWTRDPRA